MRFCLELDSKSHIGMKEFELKNWLPFSEKFNQCICSNAFKFFDEYRPLYVHELNIKPLN